VNGVPKEREDKEGKWEHGHFKELTAENLDAHTMTGAEMREAERKIAAEQGGLRNAIGDKLNSSFGGLMQIDFKQIGKTAKKQAKEDRKEERSKKEKSKKRVVVEVESDSDSDFSEEPEPEPEPKPKKKKGKSKKEKKEKKEKKSKR
jgi:hypothetical protein